MSKRVVSPHGSYSSVVRGRTYSLVSLQVAAGAIQAWEGVSGDLNVIGYLSGSATHRQVTATSEEQAELCAERITLRLF